MEKMRKSRRDEARRNKKIMSTFSTKQNTSTSSTETSKIYICFSFFSTLTIRAEKHHFPDRCATVFHWRHAPAIVVYCIHTHTRTHWNVCWPHTLKQNGHYWPLDVVFSDLVFLKKIAKSRILLACWWDLTTGQFMERSTILVLVPWRSDEAFGGESANCDWICGRTIGRIELHSKDVR